MRRDLYTLYSVIQLAGDIVTAERLCRRVERPQLSVIQPAEDTVTFRRVGRPQRSVILNVDTVTAER